MEQGPSRGTRPAFVVRMVFLTRRESSRRKFTLFLLLALLTSQFDAWMPARGGTTLINGAKVSLRTWEARHLAERMLADYDAHRPNEIFAERGTEIIASL